MKEERKCARCGTVHSEAELIWFEDERYCSDCIREISVVCIEKEKNQNSFNKNGKASAFCIPCTKRGGGF